MSKRAVLDEKIRTEYNRLRYTEKHKAPKALELLMDMPVRLSEVFSEDTVITKLYRERRAEERDK